MLQLEDLKVGFVCMVTTFFVPCNEFIRCFLPIFSTIFSQFEQLTDLPTSNNPPAIWWFVGEPSLASPTHRQLALEGHYLHRSCTYLYKGVHITTVLVIVNKCSLFEKQHKQLIAPCTLSNFCGESRRPFMTPVQFKRVRSVHGTIIFMHQQFHEIFF